MTEEESKEQLQNAFKAFPGVWSWIKTNSPEPRETVRLWAKTLEQLTVAEVESVLYRWSSGMLPVPAGYEKENFHLHIRAVVMQDRTKRARTHANTKLVESHTRHSPMQSMPVLGPFMAKCMAVQGRFLRQEITIDERDTQIEILVTQAQEQIK